MTEHDIKKTTEEFLKLIAAESERNDFHFSNKSINVNRLHVKKYWHPMSFSMIKAIKRKLDA